MNLMQTSIPTSVTQIMKAASQPQPMAWNPMNTDKLYEIVFTSISDFLSLVKRKDSKVAVVINDKTGKLRLGAVVAYHAGENADLPGNITYEFVTKQEDIEGAIVYEVSDNQFIKTANSTAYNLHSFKFRDPSFAIVCFEIVADVLLQWLDINADPRQEKSIELPGYFSATVAIEGDEKVFAIIPDGAMTRLVKDDAGNEVAAA